MSASHRLRPEDYTALARLSHECRDLGADPRRWREHLGEGLHRLLHAPLVLVGEVGGLRGGWPVELGAVEWGWQFGLNRQGVDRARELFRTKSNFSEGLARYFDWLRTTTEATASRRELVPDGDWDRSPEREEIFRPSGVEDGVVSFHELSAAPGEYAGVLACRAAHEPPFGEHEKMVLATEQRLLAPLIGRSLARFHEPSAYDLPLRIQRVLRCLLEGDSDKQIAARLRISPYTVNQYTKQIYKHFGVQGRVELLGRWIRRGWGQNRMSDSFSRDEAPLV